MPIVKTAVEFWNLRLKCFSETFLFPATETQLAALPKLELLGFNWNRFHLKSAVAQNHYSWCGTRWWNPTCAFVGTVPNSCFKWTLGTFRGIENKPTLGGHVLLLNRNIISSKTVKRYVRNTNGRRGRKMSPSCFCLASYLKWSFFRSLRTFFKTRSICAFKVRVINWKLHENLQYSFISSLVGRVRLLRAIFLFTLHKKVYASQLELQVLSANWGHPHLKTVVESKLWNLFITTKGPLTASLNFVD